MQFPKHDEVILGRRIGGIESERVRVADQGQLTTAKGAVRTRKMEVPVKLLPNRVDQNRVLVLRESVHSFRPKRDGKADEQNGLDQDDRKLEVRGDPARHAFMTRHRVAALAKTPEHITEEKPTNQGRARP